MQAEGAIKADVTVDAQGLNCPLPILKAKKALNSMQAGQTLLVLATDQGAERDFNTFARQTGNDLLEQRVSQGVWQFLLRRR
ncbi:MAG: sulfurtransferase TusA family protein [Betaproteobacteria bacterium]|jgi:tRNA 2-thiouridine synthesizing protein A|nr:sulfurtransferase TusA family protein [Betaproteobacteria bacterium]